MSVIRLFSYGKMLVFEVKSVHASKKMQSIFHSAKKLTTNTKDQTDYINTCKTRAFLSLFVVRYLFQKNIQSLVHYKP